MQKFIIKPFKIYLINPIFHKLLKIGEYADNHGVKGLILYYLLLQYAKLFKVHKVFIKRAKIIRKNTDSLAPSCRFIWNYIQLYRGRRLDALNYNLSEHLDTEQEKDLTRKLLIKHRKSDVRDSVQDALAIQLFRLDYNRTTEAEKQEFFFSALDHSLNMRLAAFEKPHRRFNENQTVKALLDINREFDNAGKRFFLISHTLLSAVRDGELMKRNFDLDLAIFVDEVGVNDLLTIMYKTDLKQVEVSDVMARFEMPNGVLIEFFYTHRGHDRFTMESNDRIHEWYFSPFDLVQFEFLGEKFWIPETYEVVLQQNYGNWRGRPIFYDRSYDCQCTGFKNNRRTLYRLLDYYSTSMGKGHRFFAHEPAIRLRDFFGIDYTDYFPDATGELAVPQKHIFHTPKRPIIILDMFDELKVETVRILDTCIDFTDQIVVGVLPLENGNAESGLALAESLRAVDVAYAEDQLADGDTTMLESFRPTDCADFEESV